MEQQSGEHTVNQLPRKGSEAKVGDRGFTHSSGTVTMTLAKSPLSTSTSLRVLTVLPSVEGVYRDGKIELREPAPKGANGRVIVTFLSSSAVDLNDHNITPAQAADLRGRLSTFADDWNDPEMDSYDEV